MRSSMRPRPLIRLVAGCAGCCCGCAGTRPWLSTARRRRSITSGAGWPARGLDFPGHFLIALDGAQKAGSVVVDPFGGGTALPAPALRALIKRVEGPSAELRLLADGFVSPITMEQPEPGGVSWTTRLPGLTVVSWSTTKPSWSA